MPSVCMLCMTGEEATAGLISEGIAPVSCLDSDPSPRMFVFTCITSDSNSKVHTTLHQNIDHSIEKRK